MQALEGIAVLDLSRVLAGPWCAQTLADLGAEVWKVESPRGGDDTRAWRPPEVGGESTYYMAANRSKKSIAVDFKSPEGRDILRRLAARADVLIENYRRGTLDRVGLGYDALAALNPRLVYCSISGYGRTGPRAEEPGYDFVIQAESGLMSITGEPDGEPLKSGVAVADILTGMNAAQAVLAALFARERTGFGQFIDVSLLDSAIGVLANVATGYLNTGDAPRRYGNAHATVVPYQIFRTRDGSLALAVGNDSQFRTLCERVIERPELAEDARFATARARVFARDALIEALSEVFRRETTETWLRRLRREGVPAGQVRSVPEVFAAPEIAARRLVAEVPDARHGTVRVLRSALGLTGTPPREPAAPPRLGEHTDEILHHVLGADEAQIARWRESGAVA